MTMLSGTRLKILWEINTKQLRGAVQLASAWWLWPLNPAWWPMAILSIFVGLGGLRQMLSAWRTILDLYAQERSMAQILNRTVPAKSAQLASTNKLRKGGLL